MKSFVLYFSSASDNHLFKDAQAHTQERTKLAVEVEKLKQENLELQIKGGQGYIVC